MVRDEGFGFRGLKFRVEGCKVAGFRVEGFGFKVSSFKVYGRGKRRRLSALRG